MKQETPKIERLQNCCLRLITKSNSPIRGEYYDVDKRKAVKLTTQFEIKFGELKEGENLWSHNLTLTNPELWFKYDMDNEGHKGTILRTFLMNHTLVTSKGIVNPNLKVANFELIDELIVNQNDYERILNINQMINIIRAMSTSQQRDVCFVFGGNPIGKTKREIFLDLLHPNTGRLMFIDWDKKIDKCRLFLAKFGDKAIVKDTEIEVMCKKAIHLGIISMVNGAFTLDGEVISETESGMKGFFKSRPDKYENQIVKVVQMRDNVFESDDIDTPLVDNPNGSAYVGDNEAKKVIEWDQAGLDELHNQKAKIEARTNLNKVKKEAMLEELEEKIAEAETYMALNKINTKKAGTELPNPDAEKNPVKVSAKDKVPADGVPA